MRENKKNRFLSRLPETVKATLNSPVFHNETLICKDPWMKGKFVPGLVSVIIPTYNCAQFIIETLDSVLSQTYRPLELLVVDDGSLDNTKEIVQNWNKKNNSRDQFELRYFFQENKGGSSARNWALIHSHGEFIQFLDADDVLSPDKIAAQVQMLSGNTQSVAYGPWRYFKNYKNKLALYWPNFEIEGKAPLKQLIGGKFIPNHSLLWRRTDVVDQGPWDENLEADQDGEYLLRFLLNGCQLLFCPNAWVYYRNDPNYRNFDRHTSKKSSYAAIQSRFSVTAKIEKILADRNLLDEEFRKALSIRYYEIAKNFAVSDKNLRKIGIENFNRLSPDGLIPGTSRFRIFENLLGLALTQKFRLFFRSVLLVPDHRPVKYAKTIKDVCTIDTNESQ